MKCTNCNKREATVFYRENINGKETKYALCDKCAAEKEKDMFLPDFFADPFGDSLLGSLFSSSPRKLTRSGSEKCPLCGATFADLAENGKAGCPKCYETFEEEFAPTLRRLHGSATHKGRAPARFKAKRPKEQQIAELEKDLHAAVDSEKYEDAAKLRDKIRQLRAQ